MKDFAALFTALDQTTKTSVKTTALATYFRTASDADKLWTIALLSGRRPRRMITTTKYRCWWDNAIDVRLNVKVKVTLIINCRITRFNCMKPSDNMNKWIATMRITRTKCMIRKFSKSTIAEFNELT